MIYIVGLSIAGFLFFLLVLKSAKSRADYILQGWMLVLALHLFLFYSLRSGLSYSYPHSLGLLFPLPALHGVFLHFYTLALIENKVLNAKKCALHLLPFLFLIALALPFYVLPANEKIEVYQNEGKGFEWQSIVQLIVVVLSGIFYSVITVLALQKYRKHLPINYSADERVKLRWLSALAIGLGIIWILATFFDEDIIFSGVVVFVLFIGFFGINQLPVFYSIRDNQSSHVSPEFPTAMEAEKYARSGLKEDEVPLMMLRLEGVMKIDKPYKNGDLTLNELADIVDISANQLSQLINSERGKTFHHFVNTYRIQEFLEMAARPENKKYTFLALAYDCGFNSKTTFNKYFKIHTGKTPSEFFDVEEVK